MPSQARGPAPPRLPGQAESKHQPLGLLQQADKQIAAGKQTAAPGQPQPKYTEIGYAGKGFTAHHEINRAIEKTMAKVRAATSSSHIPAKTTSGSSLGSFEHYSHAWNAADFGMLDGQYQLGQTTLS